MEPENIERYDRQIRLWGRHGQSKCSNSKICLINSDSLGTEILKGLCLAGIGSFTILDSHKLTPEDVGCTFLPYSSIGKSRASSVKQMLLDLNEEVTGDIYPLETYLPHITQNECDMNEDLTQEFDFWKQYNCVIACGFLYIDQIIRLSKICWANNIPLILCKSIGFFGSMRSQVREHLIIETHPDNALPDFNLDEPFLDLKEYFNSINFEIDSNINKVNSYPYIVIVYHYLKKWQKKFGFNDNRLPNCFSEKRELRSLIDEGLKVILKRKKVQAAKDGADLTNNSVNFTEQEMPFENFLEASKAVNSCMTVSSELPDSVKSIFNHPNVTNSVSVQNVSRFWLMIRAIREFVLDKNGGHLPVSGTIPDMTSSSEEYIKLQAIYTRKAREDLDSIFGLLQTYIGSSNCSPASCLYDETKLICRNIRNLQIFCTDAIYKEFDLKVCDMKEEDGEDDFITIGLCLKALDLFFSTYGRLPGCQDDQVETDISKLKDCIRQFIGKALNRLRSLDQWLYELCRCGGAELHATSAFLGGCIAQEVIKMVTSQYVPIDDTMVFNAITATTRSFRFNDTFVRSKI